jgi:hypothetical protein
LGFLPYGLRSSFRRIAMVLGFSVLSGTSCTLIGIGIALLGLDT